MTNAAAITAFDLVFGLFVAGVVVLLVLVVPFILRNGAAARRAWEQEQRAAGARQETDAAPRSVTALVLGGGGTRGAVQVGMLQVLAEHGFVPDRVYGASVGAVNGAGFAGDPTVEGVERITGVWRGIRSGDIYPQRLVHGPWQFLQQRPSVHPNSGLRRIVEEGLTFERLEDARVPFEVVATSLVDGSERWLTSGPAVDAILASAAIPAIFPPVELDGDRLVDGGVVDNVPISRAIEAGATRVVVLLCGPLDYAPPPARRPVEVMLNALFVAVHARFTRELATVPPGVEVVVCSAGGTATRDYMDFSDTDELIAEGRKAAMGILGPLGLGEPVPAVHASPSPGEDAAGAFGHGPSSQEQEQEEVVDGPVPPPSAGRGPSVPHLRSPAPDAGGPAAEAGRAVPVDAPDPAAGPFPQPPALVGDEPDHPAGPAPGEVQRGVGRLRELVDDARARELLRAVPRSAQSLAARLPRVRVGAMPSPVATAAQADDGAAPVDPEPEAQPVAPPASDERSQPTPGR